ncbi:ParB/RepB/Spo0J family partition protein [Alphaproteobacteria bacterium GH1-50]|uniref:ParB/RepB/Spo0J family partition protein n=1 Tax=Kangsaoukella pontilimi TaxID=2691042 RepID=A0A7C9MEC1_9RHOB|nr:ParB/RepB/Spo0J family partition protein [Kangsaoukella pontilimi]MXQ08252.1 ParB/RepB/Spo0J family partition protein [Kangsaoukella pontilimi]
MAQAKTERRGLGRGLSALMADVDTAPAKRGDTPARKAEVTISIDKIFPNPDQPRRTFTEEALAELAASVATKGIIQPLILRNRPGGSGQYEIVAGERRWRAAQRAQLHEVPAIVRELDDTEVLEIAIIENIQRADLNAVEEAAGYRQLMERFGHTQEKLAEALGKSRSHIANLLRLLNLPEEVQDMVRDGSLSAGHARALITAPDPLALAREVIKGGLSVRQAEKLAKGTPGKKTTNTATTPEKDADTKALEKDLAAALSLPVSISHNGEAGSGTMTLRYKDLDQLDEICRRLSVTTGAGEV